MHRIDTSTAQKDKFGAGKNGFTNGDPATGRRATDLNSDMWDAVQEEICNAIESTGIALDKSRHNQLALAISKAIEDGGFLKKSSNLSDVANKYESLSNLGGVAKSGDTMTGKLSLPQASAFGVNSTNALGGHSITFGDNDTGLKQNGDGVLDVYANNQQVMRFEEAVVTSKKAFRTDGSLTVAGDATFNGGGYITKTGLNSYSDGSGNHHQVNGLHLQGTGDLYADVYHHEQIGQYHELAVHVANGGSNGWFGFRNNGDFVANNNLYAGGGRYQPNGDINGTTWGGYLSAWLNTQLTNRDNNINNRATWDYVNGTFVRDIRLGGLESAQVWNAQGFQDQAPYVITGVHNFNSDEFIDTIYRRPFQKNVNNVWYNVGFL
ncbi:phage tail protein [Salmonella enterica]